MSICVEVKGCDQIEKKKGEVEIYLDEEGLDLLLSQLAFLKQKRTDHIHFMTPSWGGDELTEDRQHLDSLLAHHLRITILENENTYSPLRNS